MKTAFLVFLAAHMAHSLLHRRRKTDEQQTEQQEQPKPRIRSRDVVVLLTQTPAFVLAVYFAAKQGVFSRELIAPASIGIGLLAGHLIFGISLCITYGSLREIASHFVDFKSLWEFIVETPAVVGRFLTIAVAEEIIWRAAAQPIAIGLLAGAVHAEEAPLWAVAAGILIVAAAFSAVHRHFFRNRLSVSLEFLGFAVLLGVVYHWTRSLTLVIVVHAVRNIEIAYLDYLVKLEESADKQQALEEVERACLRGGAETA